MPTFSLADSVWRATDVILASEGEVVDGKIEVLETWKGDRKVGEIIEVPALKSFSSIESRTVHTVFGPKPRTPVVTGKRFIIFLAKTSSVSSAWKPASRGEYISTAVVWIENEETYAFDQPVNPGPSLLLVYGASEARLKSSVVAIAKAEQELALAVQQKNLQEKARRLSPLLECHSYYVVEAVIKEMKDLGQIPLPFLIAMLADKKTTQPGAVIRAMGEIGGAKVGAELTRLVQTETSFWKNTAPLLQIGWQNGSGFRYNNRVDWGRVEFFLSHFIKIQAALEVLKKIKYAPSRPVVSNFQKMWISYPQLNDGYYWVRTNNLCTAILEELPAPRGKSAHLPR